MVVHRAGPSLFLLVLSQAARSWAFQIGATGIGSLQRTRTTPATKRFVIIPSKYSKDNPNDPFADPSYWESLYTKKGRSGPSNPLMEGAPSGLDKSGPRVEDVKIVSFDLDDTIWPGRTIIEQANSALDAYLHERYPRMVGEGKKPLAAVMGAVAAQYPEEFLEDKDDKDSVVRFTDLRKAALANMARDAGYEDPGATAEECFDVWIKARHDVLSLLYPGTIEMMARLKARGLRLCAITNGNCDVMLVEALAAHLDFCVNAERVGARKRTGKPYEAAFKLAGVSSCGPSWVHIGDDFTEDMAAAKAFNARTIWFRTAEKKAEAEAKERMKAQRRPLDGQDLDGKPLPNDMPKFFQDKQVIRAAGTATDDYLATFIVKEFVDAEAETMEQVEAVIEGWLQDYQDQNTPAKSSGGEKGPADVKFAGLPADGAAEQAPTTSQKTHKFCIACGARIVVQAKFCSECGEAQP